jgi:hypothetical protein
MLTLIDRNGPPEALTCPAFICDVCGEPLTAEDGWVLWWPELHVNRTPRPGQLYHVHQGACDRALVAQRGDNNSGYSRPLSEFIEQLAHNTEHPFKGERGVQYIAPSGWRIGKGPK